MPVVVYSVFDQRAFQLSEFSSDFPSNERIVKYKEQFLHVLCREWLRKKEYACFVLTDTNGIGLIITGTPLPLAKIVQFLKRKTNADEHQAKIVYMIEENAQYWIYDTRSFPIG